MPEEKEVIDPIMLPSLDRVYITSGCWAQLTYMLDMIDTEFGLLGLVKMINGGLPLIDKLYCPQQYVTKSSVDFNTGSFHGIMQDVKEKDRADDLRVSIHSHQNMPSGWSHIDLETIHDTLRIGGAPWSISIVINKKYDYKARLDVYEFSLDGDRTTKAHLATELDLIIQMPREVMRFYAQARDMLEEPPKEVKNDPASSVARHSSQSSSSSHQSKSAAKKQQQQVKGVSSSGGSKSGSSTTESKDDKAVDDHELKTGVAYVWDEKEKKLVPEGGAVTYSGRSEQGSTTGTDEPLQVGDEVEGDVEERDPKEVAELRSQIKVVKK